MIAASGSDNSPVASAKLVPKLPAKVDTQGRLRVTKAQRREILAAFERSGESLPRFARRLGLKYSTVARWVQHSRPKPSGRKPQLRLLEAIVESPPETAGGPALIFQLPGGVRVEVADEQQVALAAMVVRALAKLC